MQIPPVKNQYFEKPSRNLSDRTKVKIWEKIFWISLKNWVLRMLSHRGNVEILAKIEGKEANFFQKITKGIQYKDLI